MSPPPPPAAAFSPPSLPQVLSGSVSTSSSLHAIGPPPITNLLGPLYVAFSSSSTCASIKDYVGLSSKSHSTSSGPSKDHLGTSGPLYECHSTSSGPSKEHFGTSGPSKEHLGTSGPSKEHLGTSGSSYLRDHSTGPTAFQLHASMGGCSSSGSNQFKPDHLPPTTTTTNTEPLPLATSTLAQPHLCNTDLGSIVPALGFEPLSAEGSGGGDKPLKQKPPPVMKKPTGKKL